MRIAGSLGHPYHQAVRSCIPLIEFRFNKSKLGTSPVHQAWPKPSCKAQWKGEDDKADRGRGGETTSGNGVGEVPEGSGEQRN